MAWITPKLNWTIDDYIHAVDFNRIENNILELYNYLVSLGYTIPTPASTNTTRTLSSIDFLSSINRIENNLDVIKSASISPIGYLGKKVWTVGIGFDYTDANRLETNTKQLYDLGLQVFQSFKYCGTFNTGQSGGLA
jgi:hypothetical protein